jgi:hypothetical protein
MSSSGKPSSAKNPAPAISTPPSGAYQSRVIRTAAGPGRSPTGNTMASTPEAKTPNNPNMIG